MPATSAVHAMLVMTALLALPPFAFGCAKKGGEKCACSTSSSASSSPSARPSGSAGAGASTAGSVDPASTGKKVSPSLGAATIPPGFTAKGTRKEAPAFEYRSALAYRYEGSKVLHVQLSTHARGCSDVDADERALAPGESIAALAFAPQIGKAGPTGWALMQLADQVTAGTTSYVLAKRADARVDAGDPAHEVKVTLLNAKPATKGELVVEGAIVAQGCGVFPDRWAASDPDLKARPQPKLTLEIDGQKLPVNGAVHFVSRKEIVLSTHPLSCSGDAAEQDVTFRLSDDGAAANVFGYAIDGAARDEEQTAPVKVTLQDFGLGRATDDVKLSGAFTIAGHHGKIDGSGTLISCQ